MTLCNLETELACFLYLLTHSFALSLPLSDISHHSLFTYSAHLTSLSHLGSVQHTGCTNSLTYGLSKNLSLSLSSTTKISLLSTQHSFHSLAPGVKLQLCWAQNCIVENSRSRITASCPESDKTNQEHVTHPLVILSDLITYTIVWKQLDEDSSQLGIAVIVQTNTIVSSMLLTSIQIWMSPMSAINIACLRGVNLINTTIRNVSALTYASVSYVVTLS